MRHNSMNGSTLAVWKGSPEEPEGQTVIGERNRMRNHRIRGMKKSVPKSVDKYIAAQPEAVRPALEHELRGYELRKGTVHFPLTKPVPVKLISRIATLRAAGIAAATKEPLLGREKARRKSAQ